MYIYFLLNHLLKVYGWHFESTWLSSTSLQCHRVSRCTLLRVSGFIFKWIAIKFRCNFIIFSCQFYITRFVSESINIWKSFRISDVETGVDSARLKKCTLVVWDSDGTLHNGGPFKDPLKPLGILLLWCSVKGFPRSACDDERLVSWMGVRLMVLVFPVWMYLVTAERFSN